MGEGARKELSRGRGGGGQGGERGCGGVKGVVEDW